MGTYLTYTAFGIFLFDEDNRVLTEQIIYPDYEAAADNIRELSAGNPTSFLYNVFKESKVKYNEIVVADTMLAKAAEQIDDVPIKIDLSSKAVKWFLATHDDVILKKGLAESVSEMKDYRRKVGLKLARIAVSEAGEEKDPSIKHAIDAVDEIDKAINIIAMRLREWYALHFPLLGEIIENHEEYARVISICGEKKNMTPELLTQARLPEQIIERVTESTADLLGSDLLDTDMIAIKTIANLILKSYEERRKLEEYISSLMNETAPNVTSLIGPLIGARLLSLAGSLKELARKPSSTLQILGAEKALFRSLKTGADPPKHGVIYQVPEIHSAPYWQRGKIARALAGKISIAARIDAYSETATVGQLREQFESRLKEIQHQNPEAPPPKPPKPPTKPIGRKKPSSRPVKTRKGGRRR